MFHQRSGERNGVVWRTRLVFGHEHTIEVSLHLWFLVPVSPLDGGRAARALVAAIFRI